MFFGPSFWVVDALRIRACSFLQVWSAVLVSFEYNRRFWVKCPAYDGTDCTNVHIDSTHVTLDSTSYLLIVRLAS